MEDLSFGQWVQRRRRSLLLTQAEFADQAACSLAAIRKIEAGERRPSPAIAEQLARVLDIPEAQRGAFVRFARGDIGRFTLDEPPLAPSPQPSPPQSNLPAPLTSLIGREREIAAVGALFRQSGARLVTLTGVGGTGKTRLAIAAAAVIQSHYPDGAWWVPLAPLTDEDQVVPAIAQAVGARESGQQTGRDALIQALRTRRLLLVIDNFEHVLNGAAILDELLQAAPGLAVLTTSRIPLGLYGEHRFAVEPLAAPDATTADGVAHVLATPAAQLFVERARAVNPTIAVTDAQAPALATLCRLADGLPLALELAAARTTVLSVEQIVTAVPNRLAVLTSRAPNLPARHRTMHAAIDWSYALLEPSEQQVLAQLAIFPGGWTAGFAHRPR